MTRGRRNLVPAPGPAGSALVHEASKPKPNRLSRSFRQTQQTQTATETGSPRSPGPDFKTPTRPRPRTGPGFSAESPHNDSDFQQDIIWDATSPSPRLGKRGKKVAAGVADISEIVSRIAPKHGRPKVAEPTLQQWIGDSATIPCTPDVQVPRPKKKSPRPSGVDDLLKLAKQFDFNMIHQEEEAEDVHQLSLELLSEDILESENGEVKVSALLPGSSGADVQGDLDQHMEDDLECLFDGPTQHLSGTLSQMLTAQCSPVKPAQAPSSSDGSRNLSSHGPASAALTTNTKGASGNDEFEDDWDNDDLLNDSLVFEMTQNPQLFMAPSLCSTQKPVRDTKSETPANVGVRLDQRAVSKVETDSGRQRRAFKPDSNPSFCLTRISADTRTSMSAGRKDLTSKPADKDSYHTRFSLREGSSVRTGPQQSKSEPQESAFVHRTTPPSLSAVKKPTRSFPKELEDPLPALSDFLDEDLDSFFSSDLVWDDPADDNLLCEMCDDLENQIHSLDNAPPKRTPPDVHIFRQREVLQPSIRTWDNSTQQPASGPMGDVFTQSFIKKTRFPSGSGGPAGGPTAGGSASVGAGTVRNSFSYVQTKTGSGSTSRGQAASAEPRLGSRDRFTFKKPNNPVPTVTNKVLGKCSEAEIELKKQQAMERRRQRLQAAQNLRAPT